LEAKLIDSGKHMIESTVKESVLVAQTTGH
jgi:hypothetical protein